MQLQGAVFLTNTLPCFKRKKKLRIYERTLSRASACCKVSTTHYLFQHNALRDTHSLYYFDMFIKRSYLLKDCPKQLHISICFINFAMRLTRYILDCHTRPWQIGILPDIPAAAFVLICTKSGQSVRANQQTNVTFWLPVLKMLYCNVFHEMKDKR